MAALDHHVDRYLADARRIGDGRARHAGKDQADEDIYLRHATAESSHNRLAEVQKPVGDGAFIHDVGGDDEERHRQDDEAVVDALDHLLRGQSEILPRDGEIDDRGDDHRMRDRRTDGRKTEQHDQAKRECNAHMVGTPVWSSEWSAVRSSGRRPPRSKRHTS